MSDSSDFARFRALVLDDPRLRDALLAVDDRAAFADAVSALAAEHGLTVPVADVEAALVAGRRAWLERWV